MLGGNPPRSPPVCLPDTRAMRPRRPAQFRGLYLPCQPPYRTSEDYHDDCHSSCPNAFARYCQVRSLIIGPQWRSSADVAVALLADCFEHLLPQLSFFRLVEGLIVLFEHVNADVAAF